MMKIYFHPKSVSHFIDADNKMVNNSDTDYFVLAGVPFPRNFLSIAKTILKRLFRVYAHIYHQHFPEVVQLGEEAHLNTSFKHFIYFVQVSKV